VINDQPLFTTVLAEYKAKFEVYNGKFNCLEIEKIKQVYAVVLNPQNQILLVHNLQSGWGLVGGKVEEGESLFECLKREVYEESAVVLDKTSIQECFYQKVYFGEGDNWVFDSYQVRFIARTRQIDTFIQDPAGGVDAVKWLELENLKQDLKWGQATELILENARQYLLQN
jgi:8-oxo-dGTP pyrophosphatase MutT (NUDIX family)